jgi:3-hydroxybutyryl-CoA dehydrogenase
MTRVAVIGAGTMGHALAVVFALGGHTVRLTDSSPDTLDRAGGMMSGALATLREAGELDDSWTESRLARAVMRCASLAEALADAEFIVEAIVELPDAKRALYREIAALAPEHAILASNTSSLDIFPLVPEKLKNRTMIAHWYMPPYIVDLVDIVPGAQMEPASLETVRAMIAALGKTPVVLRKFVPGYIANRIQEAILLEALRLLDEGVATPKEIDDSVIHGLALRMPIQGVLGKTDFAGLDLLRQVIAHGPYQPPTKRGFSETLDRLVAAGRTGVKAGRGFFDWGGRGVEELTRDRDRRLLALKQALRRIGVLEGK